MDKKLENWIVNLDEGWLRIVIATGLILVFSMVLMALTNTPDNIIIDVVGIYLFSCGLATFIMGVIE